jgi:hypothetical protein
MAVLYTHIISFRMQFAAAQKKVSSSTLTLDVVTRRGEMNLGGKSKVDAN